MKYSAIAGQCLLLIAAAGSAAAFNLGGRGLPLVVAVAVAVVISIGMFGVHRSTVIMEQSDIALCQSEVIG